MIPGSTGSSLHSSTTLQQQQQRLSTRAPTFQDVLASGLKSITFFLKDEEERHERNPAALEPWAGTVVESNSNETTLLFADGEEHTIPNIESQCQAQRVP